MPRIPRHPEMDKRYLRTYYANWWRRLTKRKPDETLVGRCVWCGARGVLGFDLVHRGVARPTNLLCDDCVGDD